MLKIVTASKIKRDWLKLNWKKESEAVANCRYLRWIPKGIDENQWERATCRGEPPHLQKYFWRSGTSLSNRVPKISYFSSMTGACVSCFSHQKTASRRQEKSPPFDIQAHPAAPGLPTPNSVVSSRKSNAHHATQTFKRWVLSVAFRDNRSNNLVVYRLKPVQC